MDDSDGADSASGDGSVAILAGRLWHSWGRKPVMAIAFWVLPFRILSYAFVSSPAAVVYLQGLDGIHMGFFATALAVGGVVGPLASGLGEHLGFQFTFYNLRSWPH